MRCYLFTTAVIATFAFCASSCSHDKDVPIEVDPVTPTWTYYGEQVKVGDKPFKLSLYFEGRKRGTITYGFNLKTPSLCESNDFVWKVIDGTLFIFLGNKMPADTAEAYMEGLILDNNQLKVSWQNSLGSYWDSKAPEFGWASTMILDLVELDGPGTSTPWSP